MISDHSHKMAEIGPAFLDYSRESIVNYHRMKNLQQNTFQCFPPLLLSLHSSICKKMGLIALQLLPCHSLIVHPLPRNSVPLLRFWPQALSVFFCSSSLTLTSRLAFSSIICLSFAFSASMS